MRKDKRISKTHIHEMILKSVIYICNSKPVTERNLSFSFRAIRIRLGLQLCHQACNGKEFEPFFLAIGIPLGLQLCHL